MKRLIDSNTFSFAVRERLEGGGSRGAPVIICNGLKAASQAWREQMF